MAQQHAESMAKAAYSESKDPSTCALFYAALGKKTLLQVPFPPQPTQTIQMDGIGTAKPPVFAFKITSESFESTENWPQTSAG